MKLGSLVIDDAKVGTASVDKIVLGTTVVWTK